MTNTAAAWQEFKDATAIDANQKTEHTPGPWRISGCRTHNSATGIDELMIEHGDENCISPIIASICSDVDRLPMSANARLIAAAPDMLVALKFLADAARTEPGMAIYKDHIKKSEEAIAKAEGGTQ